MKKNIQTILITLLFSGSIFGQETTIEWSKALGEIDFTTLIETSDNHFLITSMTPTGHVMKIGKDGIIKWKTNTGDKTQPLFIKQLNDGSFLIVGYTDSGLVPRIHKQKNCIGINCYSGDIWVAKLDINGKLEWQNAYGGSGIDFASIGYQTKDGGYVIFGTVGSNDGDITNSYNSTRYTYRDIWILKLSNKGEIEWQKIFGGNSDEATWAPSVQNADGTFTINAYSTSVDGDFLGEIDGQKTFELTFNEKGEIVNKKLSDWKKLSTPKTLTNDGNYVVTGELKGDLVVEKITPQGEVLWQKIFGETTSSEYGQFILQDNEKNYIVAGYNKEDFWILKLDETGSLITEKIIKGNNFDRLIDFYANSDNTYTAILNSQSTDGIFIKNKGKQDIFILTIDKDGEVIGVSNLGGTENDWAVAAKKVNDSCVLFVNTQSPDYYILENELASGLMMFKLSVNNLSVKDFTKSKITYNPNPATNQLTLTHTEPIKKASVYNYLGQLVLTQNGTENNMQLNVSNLPNGNYLVKIESDTESQTVKFVKE